MNNLIEGIVLKIIDQKIYHVKVNDKKIILCTLSNKVKIALDENIEVGSVLKIELSPYDGKRGRITYYK